MRLLTHNFILCNVAKCDKNNFPLLIEVEKSVYSESEFNKEKITSCIKKLDWNGLHKTVTSMGEVNFPKDLGEHYQNDEFLKKLHRILFDVHYLLSRLTY
jgi:multifunctional methyltransferase subunit TRM112